MNWNIKYFNENIENQILDLPNGYSVTKIKGGKRK